jgi:hypothetical protein
VDDSRKVPSRFAVGPAHGVLALVLALLLVLFGGLAYLRHRYTDSLRSWGVPLSAHLPDPPPTPKVASRGCRAGEVRLAPGQDIQAAVDGHPAGTTFCLLAGTHRGGSVDPKTADGFVGAPGAVMTGARVLSTWQRHGRRWSAGVPRASTAQGAGLCEPSRSQCRDPHDVTIDGSLLRPAASRHALRAGYWWLDRGQGRLWLAQDPKGHVVERNETPYAFGGDSSSVRIEGLTVAHYANPAQRGAISAAAGWSVVGNLVRDNHGIGVFVRGAASVRDNLVERNGELGMGGYRADSTVVTGNEVRHNNVAGYDGSWEAGGLKFSDTNGLVVRANRITANNGPGLWSDGDCNRVDYADNYIDHNSGYGIFHEISARASITGNVIAGNGSSAAGDEGGAGILVSDSFDVSVSQNDVVGNWQGIVARETTSGRRGRYGPRQLHDVTVSRNVIVMAGGLSGVTGASLGGPSSRIAFVGNTWTLSGSAEYEWFGQRGGPAQWRAWGQDTTGSWR